MRDATRWIGPGEDVELNGQFGDGGGMKDTEHNGQGDRRTEMAVTDAEPMTD